MHRAVLFIRARPLSLSGHNDSLLGIVSISDRITTLTPFFLPKENEFMSCSFNERQGYVGSYSYQRTRHPTGRDITRPSGFFTLPDAVLHDDESKSDIVRPSSLCLHNSTCVLPGPSVSSHMKVFMSLLDDNHGIFLSRHIPQSEFAVRGYCPFGLALGPGSF